MYYQKVFFFFNFCKTKISISWSFACDIEVSTKTYVTDISSLGSHHKLESAYWLLIFRSNVCYGYYYTAKCWILQSKHKTKEIQWNFFCMKRFLKFEFIWFDFCKFEFNTHYFLGIFGFIGLSAFILQSTINSAMHIVR